MIHENHLGCLLHLTRVINAVSTIIFIFRNAIYDMPHNIYDKGNYDGGFLYMKDLTIIGAGPAGMTAAIYAAGAGLSVTLIERGMYGGQIVGAAEIENYPGVGRISGWELARNMYSQVENAGIELTYGTASSIVKDGDCRRVICDAGEFTSRAVIIANGVKRRHIECVGESEFAGRGVSYCAVCDGTFVRHGDVAVVGGGNSALEDALYLSEICGKVYLIHRRNEFRAEEKYVKSALEKENIIMLTPHIVTKIFGDTRVRGISVRSVNGGEVLDLEVSGVFAAVGCIPDNAGFAEAANLTAGGYFDSSENCRTSQDGIFVAGDTRNKKIRQIVTAVSDGAAAAAAAREYIRGI